MCDDLVKSVIFIKIDIVISMEDFVAADRLKISKSFGQIVQYFLFQSRQKHMKLFSNIILFQFQTENIISYFRILC